PTGSPWSRPPATTAAGSTPPAWTRTCSPSARSTPPARCRSGAAAGRTSPAGPSRTGGRRGPGGRGGVLAPRSTFDLATPSARVGDRYFRGSGTSMSTAVVAGAAARVLAAHTQGGREPGKAALNTRG